MSKSIKVISHDACTGCGACETACRVGCISFTPDEEGFLFPSIDASRCVDCSRCLRVCPAIGTLPVMSYRSSVLLRSLDEDSKNSSSGGAAFSLGKTMILGGGAVVACAFDENGVARHTSFDDVISLRASQGSKYVQSDAREGYRECGRLLSEGREVLFVGTPCQVAAARSLFGTNTGLITCDLICHGVPSPTFWARELDWQNSQGRLMPRKSVHFRTHDKRSSTIYELGVNERRRHGIPYERDAYYSLFMENASLRESCYGCRFACSDRVGDITLGDCATRRRYPDFHPCEPVSVVVANTVRGEEFLKVLVETGKVDYIYLDYPAEVTANGQLHEPSKRSNKRDAVYRDLRSLSYADFSNRYRIRVSPGWWIKRLIRLVVPVSARMHLMTFMRGLRKYG